MSGAAITLRDYQVAAVDALWARWRAGSPGGQLIVVPTGGGKSAILGEITRRLVADHGARVLIVTHRAELIAQDADAIRRVCGPGVSVGIYSASIGRREIRSVTVAGVQSIARQPHLLGSIDVVIVDEAHLVPVDEETQYVRLLDALRAANDDLRVVGLTATEYRLDQGYLTERVGDRDPIFASIAYRVEVAALIERGYLAPLVTASTTTKIDTSGVHTRGGDYVAGELSDVACDPIVVERVCDDVAGLLAAGRTSALLFGCGVEHAALLRNAMRMRGVSCEMIVGSTPRAQRDEIIDRFRRREIQAITSCDVLTTGFDAPVVDVIALARPTQSTVLYVQMCGRGMRCAPNKIDCAVLDYGDNIARHGPVDAIRVGKKRKGNGAGDAPTKMCPSCDAEVPVSTRTCLYCDHEFPPHERKVSASPSTLPIMVLGPGERPGGEPRRYAVGDVQWARHCKRGGGGPHTLRVDYFAPLDEGSTRLPVRIVSEWVCLEHEEGGFARRKAEAWWAQRCGTPCPDTIDEALLRRDEARRVAWVQVSKDGEWLRVDRAGLEAAREPGSDDDRDDVDSEPAAPAHGVDLDEELPF